MQIKGHTMQIHVIHEDETILVFESPEIPTIGTILRIDRHKRTSYKVIAPHQWILSNYSCQEQQTKIVCIYITVEELQPDK